MLNLYLVVSEELQTWGGWYGPPEFYCIAELVVARNRSQARYLAWKTDYSFGDFRDMPRFRVNIKKKDVEGPPRLATKEYIGIEHERLWWFNDELRKMNNGEH